MSTNDQKLPPKLIVHPTQRTISVVRTSTFKHLDHEPVKGAVNCPESYQSQAPTSKDEPNTLLHQPVSSSNLNSFNKKPASVQATRMVSTESIDMKSTIDDRTKECSFSSTDHVLNRNTFQHTEKENLLFQVSSAAAAEAQLQAAVSGALLSRMNHHSTGDDSTSGPQDYSSNRNHFSVDQLPRGDPFAKFLSNNEVGINSEDEPSEDLGKLNSEVVTLKEQLEVQSKVNSDLKKLLVASIGDDLHYKVDALVRTKVQLANEIGDYTRKLVEDYEDLDKLTIQADLWHSKYQASRVLVEQLTNERDRLQHSYIQSQKALQETLTERQDLFMLLQQTNRDLLFLQSSLLQSSEQMVNTHNRNTLELASCNKSLAENIRQKLTGSRASSSPTKMPNYFTPAEMLAHEVIVSTDIGDISSSLSSKISLTSKHLPRFHPGTKYYGITYNCCKKCIGDIFAI